MKRFLSILILVLIIILCAIPIVVKKEKTREIPVVYIDLSKSLK